MAKNEETKKSGFATASLVLGIIGVCTSFIPIINNISFTLGLIGVILAIVALMKKSSKGQAVAGVILCVLAIVITINSQKALSDSIDAASKEIDKAIGNSTEEVLKNDVDVTFGKFEVNEDKYGLKETQLKANVKNKTSETKSFNIQVEAIDENGNRITSDYIYVNSLGAEQSQEFQLFTYVEESKLDKMKSATFNVVEASMY